MAVTANKLIGFNALETEGEVSSMAPDRLLNGEPKHTLWNLFKDESDQMISGVWESTSGEWKVDYSNRSEFCQILSGQLVLTDIEGASSSYAEGDAFVIPQGFIGTWKVLETVRKHYVIITPKAS